MNLYRIKLADLRKMAKKQKIEGCEDLERKELIAALTPKEEPKKKPAEEKKEKESGSPEVPPEALKKVLEEESTPGIKGGRTPKGSKAEIMKAKLAKQKKVTILIPLGKDDRPGTTTPVTLNGYRLNIQHGVYVPVPEQVAKIIMTSQKQTMDALQGPTTSLETGKKKNSILDGSEEELQ